MKKRAGFLMALAALAVGTPLAHANYKLSYDVGAGAVECANVASNTLATCFASPTFVGGAAGITMTQFTGNSNSPGTPANAQQQGSVVDIATTGPGTLTLWLAAQDFTNPVTPPGINIATSLTVIPTSGSGSVTLTSCVDQSNGTAPPLPGVFCSAPAYTDDNPTINYSGTTSQSNNDGGLILALAAPYSLSQRIVITFTTASQLQVQSRQVLAAVPEPAGIVLMGTATLGVIALLRKRAARRA
jgi:hypothetical protein